MNSSLKRILGALLALSAPWITHAQNQPVMTVSVTNITISNGSVATVTLINPGSGYAAAPGVTITGDGVGATAVATLSGTSVGSIAVTAGGAGYTNVPLVTIGAPNIGGTQATAFATLGGVSAPNPNEASGPAGGLIIISALAVGTNPLSGFTYNFFVDGISIGTPPNPPNGTPARVAWTPPRPGSYFLTVTATDGSNTATTLPVRYHATGTALTNPTPNTIVPNGSSVVLQATAMPTPLSGAGTNTFVSRMDFLADGVLIGSDATAPYSFIYTPPAAPSPHVVEARAFDNNGFQVSPNGTATMNLFMVPPIGAPPSSVINSPADGAVVEIPTGAETIPVQVSAGSAIGLINKVELYIEGELFGTDVTFPYIFNWAPTVVGDYRLIALTYDDKSNVVASTVTDVRVAASPAVTMVSPTDGATTGVNTPITLRAAATDANFGVTIARVQFFNGATFLGESTVPVGNEFSFIWTPTVAGPATISALAINSLGLSTQSDPVGITVAEAGGGGGGVVVGAAPVAVVTAPAAGSALRVNTTHLIAATATDADGNITQVEFLVNNQSVGVTSVYPYSATWTPTALGPYNITARATDNSGNSVVSAAVAVTVTDPAATPPTVAVSSPPNGATVSVGLLQTLRATASDAAGLANVQFFVNGVAQGAADTTFPFTADWTPVTPGTFVITARATNVGGSQTTSAPITVIVSAGTAPAVSITNPASGSTVPVNTAQNINATATSPSGTIASVEFFVNGISLLIDTAFPFTTSWTPTVPGAYALVARATDNLGNVSDSTTVNVTVATGASPAVAITNPANASRFGVGTPINVTASAADNDGTITRVQFLVNGLPIGAPDTTVPYSAVWTPSASGTYTLTAEAADNSGNLTVSGPVTVTIFANGAPTVSIISPTNNSAVSAGTVVSPIALAADVDGTVASVRFLVNGSVVGAPALAPPFTTDWVPSAAGTYTMVAEATDNSGNITNSAPITLFVIANTRPTVSVTAPSAGTATTTGIPVVLTANATDNDGTVTRVRFLVNGQQVGAPLTSPPFTTSFLPTSAGSFTIVAEALDNSGNIVTSTPIVITATANQTPTISITSPVNGASVRVGVGTTIAATASDPDGNLTGVSFFANNDAIGTDVSPPYSIQWLPTAEGIYRLTATATDNAGGVTTSSTVTVVSIATTAGDRVYSGSFFGLGESGRFTLLVSGQSATFIGFSTAGGGRVYFYPGISVDANGGLMLADSTGRVLIAGRTGDTGVTISTLDGTATVLIGLAVSGSGTAPVGLFSGNLADRPSSQISAIVAPDSSITIFASDGAGSLRVVGVGTVSATGAFTNVATTTAGITISGRVDPSTGFLTGTVNGAGGGSFTGALASGATISDGFLRNLSTRGRVGTGDAVLTAGFVVGGTASKRVLIRAIGPTLAQFGITAPLADPQLQLFDFQGNPVLGMSNNNWGGSFTLVTAFNQVGAFSLDSASRDAAILATLAPGSYTVQVSGVGGGTGIALVEIWDADSLAPFSPQKVMNLSTRGFVGPGQDQLSAGFVVSGNTAKKVLIRAAGPALAAVAPSLGGVLADPMLRLVRITSSGNTTVRENDNWGMGNDVSLVTEAAVKVGAFPFALGSRDAVILLSLPPGTYSAVVSGPGASTGLAIVEVYEVP